MAIAFEVRGDGRARLEDERREPVLDQVRGGGEADGSRADDGDGKRGQVVLHGALLDFAAAAGVQHEATARPMRATCGAVMPWQHFSVRKATNADIAG